MFPGVPLLHCLQCLLWGEISYRVLLGSYFCMYFKGIKRIELMSSASAVKFNRQCLFRS